MTEPPQVTKVEITAAESRLKVVWSGTDGDFDPYFIHKNLMLERSREIRQLLGDLVKARRNQTGSLVPPPGGTPANVGDILHDIASKGYSLYTGLFTDAGNSVTKPAKVRNWLETNARPRRIHFKVFDPVHIPWGLLFCHDPGPVPPAIKPEDIQHYQDFWAFRYNVSAVYSRIEATALSRAWPVEDFRVLTVRHKKAFDDAVQKLKDPVTGDPEVLKILEQFDQKAAKILYSKKELVEQWKEIANQVGLLSFYCHADQTTLAIGDASTEAITVNDFLEDLQRTNSEPPCLVFLNGCSTAVGAPESGFLTATGADGYAGFIGTETKVPTVFALRFGLAFLYLFMCKGLSIGETMASLRRAHWPLSLVYGPYCPANLQVAPNDDFQVHPFPEGNFGEAMLGDQLL